jgi:hypothetical protein
MKTKYMHSNHLGNLPASNLDTRADMYCFCSSRIHLFTIDATFYLGNHLSYLLKPLAPLNSWLQGQTGDTDPVLGNLNSSWASVDGSAVRTCPNQSQTNTEIFARTNWKETTFISTGLETMKILAWSDKNRMHETETDIQNILKAERHL